MPWRERLFEQVSRQGDASDREHRPSAAYALSSGATEIPPQVAVVRGRIR
jgi:hypothetical protein